MKKNKLYFYLYFLLLPIPSWASFVGEHPKEMLLPSAIVKNLLLEIKRQFPVGYDEHFKIVKILEHSRYYSVQNSDCSFDGLLTIDISHNASEGAMTEIMGFTCNSYKSQIFLQRWGDDLNETPGKNFIKLNLFPEDLPANFHLDIFDSALVINYWQNNEGEFTFTLTKNNDFSTKVFSLKKTNGQNGAVIWEHNFSQKSQEMAVEPEAQLPAQMSMITISEKQEEGVYWYTHFINDQHFSRPQFTTVLQRVQSLLSISDLPISFQKL